MTRSHYERERQIQQRPPDPYIEKTSVYGELQLPKIGSFIHIVGPSGLQLMPWIWAQAKKHGTIKLKMFAASYTPVLELVLYDTGEKDGYSMQIVRCLKKDGVPVTARTRIEGDNSYMRELLKPWGGQEVHIEISPTE